MKLVYDQIQEACVNHYTKCLRRPVAIALSSEQFWALKQEIIAMRFGKTVLPDSWKTMATVKGPVRLNLDCGISVIIYVHDRHDCDMLILKEDL